MIKWLNHWPSKHFLLNLKDSLIYNKIEEKIQMEKKILEHCV